MEPLALHLFPSSAQPPPPENHPNPPKSSTNPTKILPQTTDPLPPRQDPHFGGSFSPGNGRSGEAVGNRRPESSSSSCAAALLKESPVVAPHPAASPPRDGTDAVVDDVRPAQPARKPSLGGTVMPPDPHPSDPTPLPVLGDGGGAVNTAAQPSSPTPLYSELAAAGELGVRPHVLAGVAPASALATLVAPGSGCSTVLQQSPPPVESRRPPCLEDEVLVEDVLADEDDDDDDDEAPAPGPVSRLHAAPPTSPTLLQSECVPSQVLSKPLSPHAAPFDPGACSVGRSKASRWVDADPDADTSDNEPTPAGVRLSYLDAARRALQATTSTSAGAASVTPRVAATEAAQQVSTRRRKRRRPRWRKSCTPPEPGAPPLMSAQAPAQSRLAPQPAARVPVHERLRPRPSEPVPDVSKHNVDADGFQAIRSRRRRRSPWKAAPQRRRARCPVPSYLLGKCFNCLATNHVKAECTFPSKCFNCLVAGHHARHCPRLPVARRCEVKRGHSPRRRPQCQRATHRRRPPTSGSPLDINSGRSPVVPVDAGQCPDVGGGGARPQTSRLAELEEPRWGRGLGPTHRACDFEWAIMVGGVMCPVVSTRESTCCCSMANGAGNGSLGTRGTCVEASIVAEFDLMLLSNSSPSSVRSVECDPMVAEAELCTQRKDTCVGGSDTTCSACAPLSIDSWPQGEAVSGAPTPVENSVLPAYVGFVASKVCEPGVAQAVRERGNGGARVVDTGTAAVTVADAGDASMVLHQVTAAPPLVSAMATDVATPVTAVTIDDFISRFRKPLDQPIILSPPRLRVTRDPRASADEELIPRRSARLAAKSKHREPKPDAQARKILMKRLGMEVETSEPDTASFDEFQTAFALPLPEETRKAMETYYLGRGQLAAEVPVVAFDQP